MAERNSTLLQRPTAIRARYVRILLVSACGKTSRTPDGYHPPATWRSLLGLVDGLTWSRCCDMLHR